MTKFFRLNVLSSLYTSGVFTSWRKLLRLALAVLLIIATSGSQTSADAAVAKDFAVPAQYVLGACATPAEFDCVESLGVLDSKGTYKAGELLRDLPSEIPTRQDPQGNTIQMGSIDYKTSAGTINLVATLDSPAAIGCNGTCAALRFHVSTPNELTMKIRFAFRTSWMRPMNIQMKALDSNYTYQRVNGGAKWTMEGKGMPYSDYSSATVEDRNAKKANNAKADVDSTFFDFFIHHAGMSFKDSYWDPKCADQGFSVQSHNTNETGDPLWDAKAQSLMFQVFAPHFKADGDLNTGYFKYWTSNAFLDCKFPGNTLTKAPNLMIQILNEDGTSSVVTTAVSNKNGQLSFFASGFHFSSPKIVVKAAPASAEPAPQVEPNPVATPTPATGTAAKKITIKCMKKGVIKRITAVNAKCPKGYLASR